MRSLILCLPVLALATAWGQDQPKLTARELFYQPVPAAAKTRSHAVPQHKPQQPKTAVPAQQPPAATAQEPPAATAQEPPAATAQPPAEPRSEPFAEAIYTPLGLRYSILKRTDEGQQEVDVDSSFRAGDRIRVSVEANSNGYLYVVNRGSSGTWKVLFPSPEIDGGSNAVEKGRQYEIPNGFWFTFDEQAGEEKLFVIFSRQPAPDLENLIYSLTAPATAPQPSATPPSPAAPPKALVAQNIGDSVVGRLRNIYARDLIVEKIDEHSAAAAGGEKATYAVNPVGRPDARVVADITLRHR